MYLRAILLYFFIINIHANSQIDNINNFLNEKRFSYEQVTENSTEVISGKLILDTLQIYLEITSPYKESYLISKDSVYVSDKLSNQVFKISFTEEEILIIQFKDNFGVGNSIYLTKLS